MEFFITKASMLEEKEQLKIAQNISPKLVEDSIVEACDALYKTYSIVSYNYDDDYNIIYNFPNKQFCARRKLLTPTDALILFKQPKLVKDSNPFTFGNLTADLQSLGYVHAYSNLDLIKWFGLNHIFWSSFILGIDDQKPQSKEPAFFNQKAFKLGVKIRRGLIDPEIKIEGYK